MPKTQIKKVQTKQNTVIRVIYSLCNNVRKNCYKPRTRTNILKQSVSSIAVDFWQEQPFHLKELPFSITSKAIFA